MELKYDDSLLLQNLIDFKMTRNSEGSCVELIVRPECNQNCKYCYLVQHGYELYPKQIRKSKEEIINNIKLLMNYFTKKEYCIAQLDLFAGDLFFDNLFFDIIPFIYNYYKYLHDNYYEEFFVQYSRDKINPAVVIPCNMSFCEDNEKIKRVQEIHEQFKEIDVKLYFSYSTDGIYALSSREQKNLDENYFNKIFDLCEKNKWGIHPMISHENIDNAINNYNWFKIKSQQYPNVFNHNYPYFLEVRNNNWTDESIDKYKNFLLYVLKDVSENIYENQPFKIFNNELRQWKLNQNNQYEPLHARSNFLRIGIQSKNNTNPGCGVGKFDLCINCLNLSLVPCHRLAYPLFYGGEFEVENNQITNINAQENLNGYLNIIHTNATDGPGCISCPYRIICMKGCLGSQFETFGDVYFPIPSVCKLLQTKYNTIIDFYHSKGLFHYLFQNEPNYPLNREWQIFLINLGYDEYKNYTF